MKKEKQESNLSKFMKYSGNYKYLAYLSWLLAALSAVFTLLPFWYIWKIVSEAIEVSPNFGNAQNITLNAWMAVICSLAAVVFYILGLLCAHFNAFHIAANIRIHLIRHITFLPPGEKDRIGSGALRRIISDSSAATENYLAHQLPDQTKSAVMFIGLLVMMFTFDWKLALISLIPAVIGFMSIMSMAGKGLKDKMAKYQNVLSDMSNEAVEYIRGIPVVKTFGQTVFSFKRFKDSIDRYSKWASDYTRKVRLPILIYTVAIHSVFAFLIIGEKLFAGDGIIFFIVISPVIIGMLTSLMYTNETKMIVDDAIKRMESVREIKPLESSNTAHPKDSSVCFNNVTFSYDGFKNVINNMSFAVETGKTYALVGPSGGGKSTIATLIARFFDTQSGTIAIGGANIKDIPKEELMNTISFVFQDAKLIKGSILDNVRLGRPDASEQQVLDALNTAGCMDIIEKFPAGIQTLIGSKGVYLSGGEQQRMTIARAILKNAPLLILDEATAFADPDNENKIQAALAVLAKDKTVIMIAHRLSTVKNADCICVINEGTILEQGTFDELINKNGMFTSMWKDYTESVEWRI
ncbi:MAG: ABC transporter ATP-binding protein [Lachnospiraceae bacterium]